MTVVYNSPQLTNTSQWEVQWSLNNPVTNGPVVIGCNKEVAVLQMTSTKRSHPFLAQMITLQSIVNVYLRKKTVCGCWLYRILWTLISHQETTGSKQWWHSVGAYKKFPFHFYWMDFPSFILEGVIVLVWFHRYHCLIISLCIVVSLVRQRRQLWEHGW